MASPGQRVRLRDADGEPHGATEREELPLVLLEDLGRHSTRYCQVIVIGGGGAEWGTSGTPEGDTRTGYVQAELTPSDCK